MLLCEVEEYMEMLHAACSDRGVRYKEATEIAILCIEAQMRLVNLLNTLNQLKNNVFLSEDRVREILEECRYDWNEYGEGPDVEYEEEQEMLIHPERMNVKDRFSEYCHNKGIDETSDNMFDWLGMMDLLNEEAIKELPELKKGEK